MTGPITARSAARTRRPVALVRRIEAVDFCAFLRTSPFAGYQQTPAWAWVRRDEWSFELLGLFDTEDDLVGIALVRHRDLPLLPWRLSYIPEGPLLDWAGEDVAEHLRALSEYLRSRGTFTLIISPPLSVRRWDASTVKQALAAQHPTEWADLAPDDTDATGLRAAFLLERAGWSRVSEGGRFGDSQPLYNCWLSLSGRTEDEVLARMSRAWRKNLRRAERDGVEVLDGTRADLPEVHRLHLETVERLGLQAQSLSYFENLWDAMASGGPGRFHMVIARHEGELISAYATSTVGRRAQGIFSVSSSHKRDLKGSNAVYRGIIAHALADGAEYFDIGGVADSLAESAAESGVLRYKIELGCEAREYVGGWELPLIAPMHRAFGALLPLYARLSQLRADLGRRRATARQARV